MKNIKCSHCKGMFNEFEVIKYSKKNNKQYYHCNKCNTDRVRRYRNTKVGRQNINSAVYRSTRKHADKQRARQKLNYHVKTGKIVKPDKCSKCGLVGKVEGHHNDYTKPLEVDWVCKGCHSIIERCL